MYSSNFKVTMIVAAAGVGKRMGLGYPKQFLEYKGKPLFIMPLEVAQNSNIVDEIIVVTNKENVSLVENYCNQYGLSKVVKVTEGGKERQNSIYNALKYDNNSDIILVQDGVRPFLKEKYIEECCRVVAEERLGVDTTSKFSLITLIVSFTCTPTTAPNLSSTTTLQHSSIYFSFKNGLTPS